MESAFSRWVRGKPELHSSRAGISVVDLDLTGEKKIFHRFKTPETGRDIFYLMCVEVKIHDGILSDSQADTLITLNQLISNRRKTPTKKKIYAQIMPAPNFIFSWMLGRRVRFRAMGAHLLQFSGQGPEDSEKIKWDHHEISIGQLVGLLLFKIDPHTLRPMDLRVHHRKDLKIIGL